jgi:hypothetical protein
MVRLFLPQAIVVRVLMVADAIGMRTKTTSSLVIRPHVDTACGALAKVVAPPRLPASRVIRSTRGIVESIAIAATVGVTMFTVLIVAAPR